jgi:hypothetical protein
MSYPLAQLIFVFYMLCFVSKHYHYKPGRIVPHFYHLKALKQLFIQLFVHFENFLLQLASYKIE